MTIALAKTLVEGGQVSAAQMDDILQRQVIFGGSVDTNLLELGLLDETILMNALAAVHNLPPATAEVLAGRDPRMAKLFPARLSHKYQVIPISMSGRSLIVLAAGRIHPVVIDEINFMLSLAVKPHLVCEVRLQQLLHDWVGVDIEPRYRDLAARLGAFPGTEDPGSPSVSSPPEALAAAEALAASRRATPQARPDRIEQALSGLDEQERRDRARREQARSGRVSLPQATKMCMNAVSREALVDGILRFSRQFMAYVGLFVVHDDAIFGWDAVGSEDAGTRIRNIRLPVTAASVLGTVVKTRATYLGPVQSSGNNNDLLRALGRERPRNALIVPISVKGRLIGLLYGDAGDHSIRGVRIQALLVFASRLGSAFQQLILRLKSQAPQVDSSAAEPDPIPDAAQMAEQAALRASGQTGAPVAGAQEVSQASAFAEPPMPVEAVESPVVVEPLVLPSPARAHEDLVPVEALAAPPSVPVADPPEPVEASEPAEVPDPPEAVEDLDPVLATDPLLEPVELPELTEQQEADGASGLAAQPADAQAEVDYAALPPAVTPSKVDLPAVGPAPGLQPGESRVQLEALSLDEEVVEHASVSVDTDDGAVVVDTGDDFDDFAPAPPAEAPSESASDLEVVELGPGLRLDRHAAGTQASEELASEQVRLLLDALEGQDSDGALSARERLLSAGPKVLPLAMERFPGKLLFDVTASHDAIPPVVEHGALLGLLVAFGQDACEAVADQLEQAQPIARYYAVLMLGALRCERVVPRLAGRLYDRDAKVRLAAIDSLRTYRKTLAYATVLKGLRRRLGEADSDQQAIAAALLGNFRDVDALPLLVGLVKCRQRMVARAAIESLGYITKQDFGTNERKWLKWWKTHKGESRIKWLIVGLRSRSRDIRFSSAQELSEVTDEYFGYYFDSEKADREKAVRRWEQWWDETGRRLRYD